MYKISATETHNEKATDFETKALLYLINYYKDSDKIHWLVVDFFNDVTGVNRLSTSCYDVQSKGIKDICPSNLGKYLVTLFKNYLSDFNFEGYVLFVEGVGKTISDQICGKDTFGIANLDDDTKSSIVSGLKSAANEKTYIEDKSKIKDTLINDFLSKVVFVVDSHSKEEYVKAAVKYSSSVRVDDLRFRTIFKELRDMQSAKKNNDVEGETIETISKFFCYDKYFKVEDIQSLILSRICFNDFVYNIHRVPIYFNAIYNAIDETIRNDRLEDCVNSIFRILMDKNNRDSFWTLFDEIVKNLNANPTMSVDEIYSMINQTTLSNVPFLDQLSAEYLVALLKERVIDDQN